MVRAAPAAGTGSGACATGWSAAPSRFCGREHEDEVFRRLLDDLQQRVEAGRGDHVRLIDDEDAVARLRRRGRTPGRAVRGCRRRHRAGGVEFDDVDRSPPLGASAMHGRERRTASGGAPSQRAGEDRCRGRLATAARPGEQVGVIDPSGRQSVGQRFGDVLPGPPPRRTSPPVLAVERHVSRLPTRADGFRSQQLPSPRATHRWPARRWRRPDRTAARLGAMRMLVSSGSFRSGNDAPASVTTIPASLARATVRLAVPRRHVEADMK